METGQRILVAGSTGRAGRAYTKALVEAGHRVSGTVRPGKDRAGVGRLGAEPVEAELSDRASAERAVRGMDGVVIAILGRGEEAARAEERVTANLIDAAREAGVGRVVYTSVHLSDASTGVPHFDVKAGLEARLRESGLAHTILRPATFMDSLNSPWLREGVEREGVLVSPIGLETRISYISTSDLAWFAVRAFEGGDLDDATLSLGGPEAVSYADLLPLYSRLADRELEYRRLPIEEVERRMGPDMAAMIELFNTRGFEVDMEPVLERFDVTLTTVRRYLETAWTDV
ncbi:MAG: SDR family oxidoreductase [Gemmatimonadota bacterium]